MPIAHFIVPAWYLEARKSNVCPEELRGRVREFCLHALQERAAAQGKEPPASVSEALVDVTLQMYEDAMAEETW